ncbi:MAG TPA: c-type cytochrome [Terracidiphilus sp.]|nr:c-type cytochrome [Terracidiphilus sp.]
MLKSLSVIAVAGMLAVSAGYADQSNAKVVIAVQKTRPINGKQMYTSYCAPCHGIDGRGGGPVASALKQPPTDLTMLAKNNGGKFPSSHIATVLEYGSELPVHGTAQMPVWGPVLGKMDQQHPDERLLRISNLSQYLRSMQAK